MNLEAPISNLRSKEEYRSFACSKDELKRLIFIIQERLNEAYEIEARNYTFHDEATDQDKENVLRQLKECYSPILSVYGDNGKALHGEISNVFDSADFPEDLDHVYFSNSTNNYNFYVRNSLTLFVDFRRPSIMNFSIAPTAKTFNETNIEVNGKDSAWVDATRARVSEFIGRRPSGLRWIHADGVYDLLIYLVILPAAFWLTYRISQFFSDDLESMNAVLVGAIYVYLIMFCLIVFRTLFFSMRWVWPPIEYKDGTHGAISIKNTIRVIVLSVVAATVYDILNAFF